MKTETLINIDALKETLVTDKYEVIENEVLSDCNQRNNTISGALLKNVTFKNVNFENCIFFGSKIEDCKFVGCNFKNCSFQFTNIEQSSFASCNFTNIRWESTNIVGGEFKNSIMDVKTMFFVTKGDNKLKACFRKGQEGFGSLRNAIAA